jgi:hypothetical protein
MVTGTMMDTTLSRGSYQLKHPPNVNSGHYDEGPPLV